MYKIERILLSINYLQAIIKSSKLYASNVIIILYFENTTNVVKHEWLD